MMTSSKSFFCLSRPARTEAYAGLLILLLGVTVLAFARCPSRVTTFPTRSYTSPPRTGRGALPGSVSFGSAPYDGKPYQGWWVGHFVQQDSLRRTTAVETKWVTHNGGRRHDGFATNRIATSMAILISGKHRLEFESSYVVLENPGDYVIWGPGVAHSWTALEHSTMLCIRWPSLPGDQGGQAAVANSSTDDAERVSVEFSELATSEHELHDGHDAVDSSGDKERTTMAVSGATVGK
ncbi:RmlC-like cupin [Gracilaria domingensis]|nr:RmlC-like cupin [Gracilaria domingensis]